MVYSGELNIDTTHDQSFRHTSKDVAYSENPFALYSHSLTMSLSIGLVPHSSFGIRVDPNTVINFGSPFDFSGLIFCPIILLVGSARSAEDNFGDRRRLLDDIMLKAKRCW